MASAMIIRAAAGVKIYGVLASLGQQAGGDPRPMAISAVLLSAEAPSMAPPARVSSDPPVALDPALPAVFARSGLRRVRPTRRPAQAYRNGVRRRAASYAIAPVVTQVWRRLAQQLPDAGLLLPWRARVEQLGGRTLGSASILGEAIYCGGRFLRNTGFC